jgi:hypothetical protein
LSVGSVAAFKDYAALLFFYIPQNHFVAPYVVLRKGYILAIAARASLVVILILLKLFISDSKASLIIKCIKFMI